ncbi:MAG: helix-turn-helix domain-containing protein [Candidatus Zixiibacteriota bacterium]
MAWLTKKEAAEHLNVCESTIDNMESAGLLSPKRIYLKPGAKRAIVRYKQEDLDALFEKRQRGRPREDKMAVPTF